MHVNKNYQSQFINIKLHLKIDLNDDMDGIRLLKLITVVNIIHNDYFEQMTILFWEHFIITRISVSNYE